MTTRREHLGFVAAATLLAAASSASAQQNRTIVGTVTTPPRVLASPHSFRVPAYQSTLQAWPTRVRGASYTLNAWGPQRFGSAVPLHPRQCGAPVALSCAPQASCGHVGCPASACSHRTWATAHGNDPHGWTTHGHGHHDSGTSLLISAGGRRGPGISLSVGLPCGCKSVNRCSHRR